MLNPIDGFIHRLSALGVPLASYTIGTAAVDTTLSLALNINAGVWVGVTTSGSLGGPVQGFSDFYLGRLDFEIGSEYCAPAVRNSTGQSAQITVAGSGLASDNALDG